MRNRIISYLFIASILLFEISMNSILQLEAKDLMQTWAYLIWTGMLTASMILFMLTLMKAYSLVEKAICDNHLISSREATNERSQKGGEEEQHGNIRERSH